MTHRTMVNDQRAERRRRFLPWVFYVSALLYLASIIAFHRRGRDSAPRRPTALPAELARRAGTRRPQKRRTSVGDGGATKGPPNLPRRHDRPESKQKAGHTPSHSRTTVRCGTASSHR